MGGFYPCKIPDILVIPSWKERGAQWEFDVNLCLKMRLKIHFKNVLGMVTSWTCKFWLEFWVCARGIPYPAENADIPAGIGVCPTSEGNPFSHCLWDRKEKWEIEALLRNGWKGCWEWECLNSSDVSKFMDLILGITPGIPAWYPQHILGMPLPPFSCLFHSTRTICHARNPSEGY